jgi:hypothetical protein
VTADCPGSTCGRHCAACHFPGGLTPQRVAAHWRNEHRGTPLTHTHHGGTA